jgi:hypothetical protein
MGKNKKKTKKPTQTLSLAEFTGPQHSDEQFMPKESLSQLGIVPVSREPTERMSRAEQDAHWRTTEPEEEVDWSVRGTEVTGPSANIDKEIDWSRKEQLPTGPEPQERESDVDWSRREEPIARQSRDSDVDWSLKEEPIARPVERESKVDWSKRLEPVAPPKKSLADVQGNWRENAKPVASRKYKSTKHRQPEGNWRKSVTIG